MTAAARARAHRRAAGRAGRTPACWRASRSPTRRSAGTSCCPSGPSTSTAAPSSCRRGVSHGPRLGFSSDSKRRTVTAASAQSASRLQRKTPSAGHAARSPRIDRRYRDRVRGLSRGGGNSSRPWLPSSHEQHQRPRTARAPVAKRRRPPPQATPGRKLPLVLVGLAVLLAAAGVAAGSAVLAFDDRCELAALRPDEDRPEHVRLRGGQLAPRGRSRRSGTGRSSRSSRSRRGLPRRRSRSRTAGSTTMAAIDAEGIARALWRDVKAGRVVEGGSTISQQLVRNLYISNERTVERKVTEACLAMKLDGAWSKERILTTYLNSVFYGNLAYGAEAAARTYFSRPARWLTLPQAALLAGLNQAPSAYDPFVDPARAVARRNQVLSAMLEEGVITRRQYAGARKQRSPKLRPGRLYAQIREPYFFGYVRNELVKEYGAETVRSGGLQVYTTIEPRWQRLAQQAIRSTLTRRTDPAAAVISINPWNGAIRAMTAVVPGRGRQPVQPALAGATPTGLDLQDVRPRRRGRARPRSELDLLRVGAVRVQAGRSGRLRERRRRLVVREDVRLELQRLDVRRARDAQLGQLRLRPADPRRRPAAGRLARAAARRANSARRPRPVRAGHGPRLDRGLPPGHGLGVRDPRGRRDLHGADGDPQGRSSAASRTTAGQRIAAARACSRTASRPSSPRSSRTTFATGRARGPR